MGCVRLFCACVQTPIRLRKSAEAAAAEELRTGAAVQEMIHGPPTQSGPRPTSIRASPVYSVACQAAFPAASSPTHRYNSPGAERTQWHSLKLGLLRGIGQ